MFYICVTDVCDEKLWKNFILHQSGVFRGKWSAFCWNSKSYIYDNVHICFINYFLCLVPQNFIASCFIQEKKTEMICSFILPLQCKNEPIEAARTVMWSLYCICGPKTFPVDLQHTPIISCAFVIHMPVFSIILHGCFELNVKRHCHVLYALLFSTSASTAWWIHANMTSDAAVLFSSLSAVEILNPASVDICVPFYLNQ